MIINFLKFTTFGRYPQSKVTDVDVIKKLNELKLSNVYNKYDYIEYDEKEYKEYNDDYYLVEPIKWKILEINNNTYKLVSDAVLDECIFYYGWLDERDVDDETIYPNNYEYSEIRAWLNGYDGTGYNVLDFTNCGFIDIAFTEEEKKLINIANIDNSAQSTFSLSNEYCNDTYDKIYLLSYQDVTKYFKNKEERVAKTTDYTQTKETGVHYWLRSPDEDINSNYVDSVNKYGTIQGLDVVNSNGVRPAIEITIK